MNNPLILHVNYVEQGQTIDEMCERAVQWGYDGIEFRYKRRGIEEPAEAYLDAIAKAVERTGLKQVLFGGPGPNLMLAGVDMRKKELDAYADFCRMAAKRFDLTVNNTMTGALEDLSVAPYYEYDKQGSSIATDEQWQAAIEGFRVLGDLAAELGFRFAFETHMTYMHDLPQSARKLVDGIDRASVGINLDYVNILWFPNPPSLEETIEICGDRIYLVHLKNGFKVPARTYQNYIGCPLSDGCVNNRQFLRLLKERGYDGPLVIEAPRPGDREWFAQEDLAYAQSLMRDLA